MARFLFLKKIVLAAESRPGLGRRSGSRRHVQGGGGSHSCMWGGTEAGVDAWRDAQGRKGNEGLIRDLSWGLSEGERVMTLGFGLWKGG